jgi:phenylalanyl-tRNA synthetase beta chain
VIDVAITPNRQDCMGVRGIARDLAAAGLGTLKPLAEPIAWRISDRGRRPGPDVRTKTIPRAARPSTRRPCGRDQRRAPEWMRRR